MRGPILCGMVLAILGGLSSAQAQGPRGMLFRPGFFPPGPSPAPPVRPPFGVRPLPPAVVAVPVPNAYLVPVPGGAAAPGYIRVPGLQVGVGSALVSPYASGYGDYRRNSKAQSASNRTGSGNNTPSRPPLARNGNTSTSNQLKPGMVLSDGSVVVAVGPTARSATSTDSGENSETRSAVAAQPKSAPDVRSASTVATSPSRAGVAVRNAPRASTSTPPPLPVTPNAQSILEPQATVEPESLPAPAPSSDVDEDSPAKTQDF
ncbi:MAG: hypothetical protein KF752_16305 [Pirellulaceae bacterium]|nr:hypothetical protein [Pirellulaceae bacterium]